MAQVQHVFPTAFHILSAEITVSQIPRMGREISATDGKKCSCNVRRVDSGKGEGWRNV